MSKIGLPSAETLAALGAIALRHGQLDFELKMTIKDLCGCSIETAINATARQSSADLRKRVRALVRQRHGDGNKLVLVDSILTRARRATEKRNDLLHSLWAAQFEQQPVKYDENHKPWPMPSAADLSAAADELAQIRDELFSTRKHGLPE
jgi:hypothetical protein